MYYTPVVVRDINGVELRVGDTVATAHEDYRPLTGRVVSVGGGAQVATVYWTGLETYSGEPSRVLRKQS